MDNITIMLTIAPYICDSCDSNYSFTRPLNNQELRLLCKDFEPIIKMKFSSTEEAYTYLSDKLQKITNILNE